jgi:predicted RNA binding protein YcfA (HicA-like mRNA interferase family)
MLQPSKRTIDTDYRMAKLDKLLERIRNNHKTVSFNDLETLLISYGFELVRSRGSHHIFRGTVAGRTVKLVIPFRRPHVKQAYVKEVLALISEIEGEDDADG